MKTLFLLSAFLLASSALSADAPVVSPLAPQVLDAKNAASERAANYEDALARAKATGKDIAVFQYGSDWNPASLSLFQNVWGKEALLRELGPGFIVLAIDNPEVVGGRAVYGRCTAEKCGLTGYSDTAIGSSAPLRLEAQCGDKGAPPANEVTTVTADSGAAFAKRADGAWLVDAKAANPATDTLTLKMKTVAGGKVLRLDFPPDAGFAGGGTGRSGNGNAVISEVEVAAGGKSVRALLAWGSCNSGGTLSPLFAVDGDSSKADCGWDLRGYEKKNRTLLVLLEESVPAGADLSVRLVCKTQHANHVVGAVRAALVADSQLAQDVSAVAQAQWEQYRNSKFTFGGWGKMPRLSLLDAQGRPVGANPSLSIHLTAKDLATELKTLRARREKRDVLWAQAEKAAGPAKAGLLRQSLDALNLGRDPEFGRHNGWGGGANGPYDAVHRAMRAADPQDESGAIRWLGFSQGAWGGIPWKPTVKDAKGAVTAQGNEWWKELEGKPAPTDADYAAADACIQRELDDPRNRLLENDHRQHILKARYDLYLRQCKGDRVHDKVLEVQRQIAKIDPDTFWGVGAIGYVGMYRRSDQPFVSYGFDAKYQTKPGANAWVLADAWRDVDHAGAYKFSVVYQGGKDSLKITRMAVVVDGRELGQGKPEAGKETLDANNRTVEIPLALAALPAGAKAQLKVEYEAKEGPLELIGGFGVEPVLVEE